jgi:hypothetical protein
MPLNYTNVWLKRHGNNKLAHRIHKIKTQWSLCSYSFFKKAEYIQSEYSQVDLSGKD